MEPIVVNGLEKVFAGGVKALSNVSFTVGKGEIFGLLGPNGAGKTTLVNILSTLLLPEKGSAKIMGMDPAKDSLELRKIIGLSGGYARFFPKLTGREHMEFYADCYGVKPGFGLAKEFQMENKLDVLIEDYSSGMLQRLGLIIALQHRPKVVLLDEPTIGLDPQIAAVVRKHIKRLKSKCSAVLITTHNMYEAEEICDRVAFIDRGKIIAIDTPKKLLGRTKSKTLEKAFIKLAKEGLE